jgi:hypothetical protein
MKRTLLVLALSLGFNAYASNICHFLLAGRPIPRVDGPALTNQIYADIGQPKAGESSVTVVDFPLVDDAMAADVFAKMLEGAESNTKFFSQFRISPEGSLAPIDDDETVAKDSGDEISAIWNRDENTRKTFAHIYRRAKALEQIVNAAIPETELEIGEVIFSYQVGKPPEGWHLDHYDTEYLIATQAFIAKKLDENGDLQDEPLGGTEYLIMDAGSQGKIQIAFNVNQLKPFKKITRIETNGVSYATPTGMLAMHIGTSRVQRLMGLHESFNMVSPAHRGAQTLDFRGSIAIRFKPKKSKR